MTFITKSTKVNCIVATSIIGVLLLTLIMISTLINVSHYTKVLISFIYAVSVLVITLFWQGILHLRVFNDYKSQNKLLCADGVVSIVLSVLLLICGVLFGVLQVNTVLHNGVIYGSDLRIFIASFIGTLAIWRICLFIVGCVKKHFNCWYELVIALGWLALTIICIVSMFVTTFTTIGWLCVAFSWLIILMYLTNLIHTYTISTPTFLETAKAIELYNQEQEDLQVEQEYVKAKVLKVASSSRDLYKKGDVVEKLKKLRELRDSGFISDEKYEDKKADILNRI